MDVATALGSHSRHSANPRPSSGAQTLTPIPLHGSGHGGIPVEWCTGGALGVSEPILCSVNQGAEVRGWTLKGFLQKGEWMEQLPSCLWLGRTQTRHSWVSGQAGRWAQINRQTTPEALSTLASARSESRSGWWRDGGHEPSHLLTCV